MTETYGKGITMKTMASAWIAVASLAACAATGCTVTSAASDAGSNSDDDGSSNSPDDGSVASDAAAMTDGTVGSMTPADASTDSPSVGPDAADAMANGDGGPDGGLGGSCIGSLIDSYVQRTDGALLAEGNAATASPEQPVVDSSTGMPLAGIVSVQEGQWHGCAAVSSGSALCWQTDNGHGNSNGQLGNGTTASVATLYRATPVLTAASTPLTKVVAVADGAASLACAVTSEGKLYCWGDLTWIVNNGTTLYTGYAQAITKDGATPLSGVIQATVGQGQACALVQGTPNTVWCWGNNDQGALGLGDTMKRQYPTQVLGFTNPTKLVATQGGEGATICALDGANVRCWGSNFYGNAGVNSATNPILSPTLVVPQTGTAALDGVLFVAPGNAGFSALRNDSTLWTWGNNTTYAANYGITNVLAVGWADKPRYVTSDGVYHIGMTNVTVKCGAL
jgi:hypothetical protein